MAKKKTKAIDKKIDLVVTALLSRLTDFQLQSNLDDELLNELEELREYLVQYKKPLN